MITATLKYWVILTLSLLVGLSQSSSRKWRELIEPSPRYPIATSGGSRSSTSRSSSSLASSSGIGASATMSSAASLGNETSHNVSTKRSSVNGEEPGTNRGGDDDDDDGRGLAWAALVSPWFGPSRSRKRLIRFSLVSSLTALGTESLLYYRRLVLYSGFISTQLFSLDSTLSLWKSWAYIWFRSRGNRSSKKKKKLFNLVLSFIILI